MGNSYKERLYSTSYIWREDPCADANVGRGVDVPSTTHFNPKNIILAETGMMGIFINLSIIIHYPPMALFSSRYHPVGASDGSLFVVADEYGKGGVGPSTTHLASQKVDCWTDGDNSVLSGSKEYPCMSH